MSELLNSGQVGLTTLRTLASQRTQIIENWGKSLPEECEQYCDLAARVDRCPCELLD